MRSTAASAQQRVVSLRRIVFGALDEGPAWLPYGVSFAALFLMLTSTWLFPLRLLLSQGRWLLPAILAAVGLAYLLRTRRPPPGAVWVHLWIGAFILTAVGSAAYSVDPETTLRRASSLVLFHLAIFIGISFYLEAQSEHRIVDALLNALRAALLVSAATLLFPNVSLPYYGRFRGIFENPNTLGLLAGLSLPLTLARALDPGRSQRARWLLPVLVAVFMVTSGSRTALVTGVVGSLYVARRLAGTNFALGVCAALAAAFLAWIPVSLLIAPPQARPSEQLPTAPREAASRASTLGVAAPTPTEEPAAPTPTARAAAPTTAERAAAPTPMAQVAAPAPTEESTAPAPTQESAAPEPTEALPGRTSASPFVIEPDFADFTDTPAEDRLRWLLTLSGRGEDWRDALGMIARRPLLGYGFGTEDIVFGSVRGVLNPGLGAYVHNSYLGMALQTGLIGTGLFFVPLLALALREVRHEAVARHPDRVGLAGVLASGLAAGVFESWPYSMGNAYSFFFWCSVMMLWLWDTRPRRRCLST